jgi:hypothetical protein
LPGRPALLKDLDDHDAVRALQAETRVLGNDVTVDVLGDDLVSIARRSGKNVEHHGLDGVSQSAEFLRRSTLLDIDPDQWHGYNPILLRHNVKLDLEPIRKPAPQARWVAANTSGSRSRAAADMGLLVIKEPPMINAR